MVTPLSALSLAKRPTSPTSSLEVIASTGEETKKWWEAFSSFLLGQC